MHGEEMLQYSNVGPCSQCTVTQQVLVRHNTGQ